MARPQNPDLTKYWKICLPATLAGTVEFYLFDNLHNKPKYGARGELLTSLLSDWVALQKDPDARAKVILDQLAPLFTSQDDYNKAFDAIKRGLETELAPSIVPSAISSLA